MFGPVLNRGFVHDFFKLMIEMGNVMVAAGVADLRYAQLIIQQKPAGMAYPDLNQELEIGLSCFQLEVTAE
jgi:hypothetical protein